MTGKAFLLKIGDGQTPPNYQTVAGLRTVSEQIGDTVSITAHGIFLGSDAENSVRRHALAGTVDDYELSYEDGKKLHRRFLIQRLDYAGHFNGERSYTIQLESADGRAGMNLAALDALIEAAEGLRQGIREAGVKRQPALYQRVMAFDAALANLRGGAQ